MQASRYIDGFVWNLILVEKIKPPQQQLKQKKAQKTKQKNTKLKVKMMGWWF